MNSREYRQLQEAYFGVYDIDEVWGRGKVDPNYGTHNRGNERTGQQPGGSAMTKAPADKMRDKLARTKGLKPSGSELSPNNQRRVRRLQSAIKRAGDESSGQQVQNLRIRKRERERTDLLTADARERGREEGRKESQNESYDLYDIILSHLLDEGFADTLEAAEGIMVSMSEEWREEILDEAIGFDGLLSNLKNIKARLTGKSKKTTPKTNRVSLDTTLPPKKQLELDRLAMHTFSGKSRM